MPLLTEKEYGILLNLYIIIFIGISHSSFFIEESRTMKFSAVLRRLLDITRLLR